MAPWIIFQMIYAIVEARHSDKNAGEIIKVLNDHNKGDFNDNRVKSQYLSYTDWSELHAIGHQLYHWKKKTSGRYEQFLCENPEPGHTAAYSLLQGQHSQCNALQEVCLRPLDRRPPWPSKGQLHKLWNCQPRAKLVQSGWSCWTDQVRNRIINNIIWFSCSQWRLE